MAWIVFKPKIPKFGLVLVLVVALVLGNPDVPQSE